MGLSVCPLFWMRWERDVASFVAPAELGDEAVSDAALFVGARGAVDVRPLRAWINNRSLLRSSSKRQGDRSYLLPFELDTPQARSEPVRNT